jgi:hypothetical protein
MFRQQHLNIDVAIRHFLENVEGLARLPLLTDVEMEMLLGPEVARGSAVMAHLNLEKNICGGCEKRCCPMVKCELYDTRFSLCPIFDYRPLICRMHYCDRFVVSDKSFIQEFADIYLNALIEAKIRGSKKVNLFDSPPFSRYAQDWLAAVTPALNEFKAGTLGEADTLRIILFEAERYRTPASFESKIQESEEVARMWEGVRRSFHEF